MSYKVVQRFDKTLWYVYVTIGNATIRYESSSKEGAITKAINNLSQLREGMMEAISGLKKEFSSLQDKSDK